MANELATLDDLFVRKPRISSIPNGLDDLFVNKKQLIPASIASERAIFRSPNLTENVAPVVGGLGTINRIFNRGEAAIAEPLMSAVRKKYPVFGENAVTGSGFQRGIRGESFSTREQGGQTQLGDVIKEYPKRAFGVNIPDPIANALGLAAVTALTGGAEGLAKVGVKGSAELAGKTFGAAQKGAGKVASRIARNIIFPTGSLAKRGEQIATNALEQDVLRATPGRTAEASQAKIDKLMAEVDDLASKSNVQTNLRPAFRRAAASAKYWIKEGKPDRAQAILNEVNNIANAKGLNPETPISVQKLLNLRRSGDEALRKLKPGGGFFSETIPADIEARQEFLGGMRKTLGQAVPEIGQKNRTISGLIDVANASTKRAGVSSRNNILSLPDYILAATGAEKLLLPKKLWQAGKALTARGLYNFSQLGKSAPKTFGKIPTVVSEDIPIKEIFGKTRKLLPAPREPIIPVVKPNVVEPKALRAPLYLEQSPIVFPEPEIFGSGKNLYSKYFTKSGSFREKELPTALQIALRRKGVK